MMERFPKGMPLPIPPQNVRSMGRMSAPCPNLTPTTPTGLMTHATSWPTTPDFPIREGRPHATVFAQHNAETATAALSLLDFLGMHSATAPLGAESDYSPSAIALAKKGRKFSDTLLLHRNFPKARHVMRSNRMALTYNRVLAMGPGEEYRVLAEWYRTHASPCRKDGWGRWWCVSRLYNSKARRYSERVCFER